MENMKTVVFNIEGEKPDQTEVEKLSKLPFGKGLPGGFEVKRAIIMYEDKLALSDNKNKTKYIISAKVELHITQYYIKSGKFWFPYDPMPVFQREKQVRAKEETKTHN